MERENSGRNLRHRELAREKPRELDVQYGKVTSHVAEYKRVNLSYKRWLGTRPSEIRFHN